MICNKCGREMKDGMKFCESCGSTLAAPIPGSPPIPPQAAAYPPQASLQTHPPGYPPQQMQAQPPIPPQPPIQGQPPIPGQGRRPDSGSKIAVIAIACIAAAILITIGGLLYFNSDEIFSGSTEPPPTPAIPVTSDDVKSEDDQIFISLLDELFADWVTCDTISLHFTLRYPEALGIERPAATYGSVFTPEQLDNDRAETAYVKNMLGSIDEARLNKENRIVYDILERSVGLAEILEEKEDYAYYTGYVRPVTGIQVQLPILLAEFTFYSVDDIDIYLDLLGDTIRYFDDIIAFERERAARGYFLNDANLGTVIEQLETFITQTEDSMLITIFNDKADAFTELDEQQREDYKERNKQLVNDNVMVAYRNMLEAMKSLKGTGGNSGGLADLPDGGKVAHALLRSGAGTDRSASDLEMIINRWRSGALSRVRTILIADSDIMDKYISNRAGIIPGGTPEEYLNILQEEMAKDFPAIDETSYKILEVHKSLREFSSPAFFIVPAVDSFDDNVIYINPSKYGSAEQDNLSVFTVLGHEGFPGHLYESVYARQQQRHPIRSALSNRGYTEGWATYAEDLSYGYAGLDELEAEFMAVLNMYFTFLQAHVDIGVNLLGWGTDEVAQLLKDDLDISDAETIEAYFNSVTGMPLNISMYALGYIEIMMLKEDREDLLGSSFNLYDFHKSFLDIGPAPFSVIRKYMG